MLGYLRQTIAHAMGRTLAPTPGPVHLNAPFRDPLPPIEDATARGLEGQLDQAFFSHLEQPLPVVTQTTLWQRPITARGLIVAGPAAPECASRYASLCLGLAEKLGWPVLADALSPLRTHAAAKEVVTCYDAILRDATLARDLTPRTVLCLGGWPTSKVLRGWLEASGAEILLVASSAANRDALHGKTRQIVAPVESLAVSGEKIADSSYRAQWQRAESAARVALDAAMERETALFEGKACWLLARALPAETPVFVASSMPVRDVEYFWPANARGQRLFFNRGANGIDGTLSTALGIAHGGRPAVMLTGDLALLHDANGFLVRPKLRGSLTIVLINNRGGGIFEHLPVAKFDPPFEEFFATPQDVDFAQLCAAHGVEHVPVNDWAEFERRISTLPTSGIRVLELTTDRKRDAATRKRCLADAGAAART
jgi:2-succinyl-5-enolpyruvyl-6-hydroxy-3-cyclohexene-1-carboxylate synthase